MYETLARYYDQIHASLTADIPLILQLAAQQDGPVLELGCGSGRVLLPLARAGFHSTGIDNSSEMVKLARVKLAEEPVPVQQAATLIEDDIRHLSPDAIANSFDLTLISYNTLLHFREGEIRDILRGVAQLFLPTGQLFIDVTNPFLITGAFYSGGPQFETRFIDAQSGKTVEQWSTSSLDQESQTVDTSWIFRSFEDKSVLYTIDVAYHYQFPHQLEMLLQQSGFRLDKIMGDYSGESFGEESERLLLLARREV